MNEFRRNLKDLRDERLSWSEFEANLPRPKAEGVISRGAVLRLYAGSFSSAFLEALPADEKCVYQLERKGLDFDRFESLENAIDEMIKESQLEEAKKPSWFRTPQDVLGAQAFFKSKSCGSIWWLVVPERAQQGFCTRIG